MKFVQIFKTSKNFIIMTMYKTESWTYIVGEPIWLLPSTVELEELEKKVFESLSLSRSISKSEEDKIWLGNTVLKKIGETSFNKFYTKSASCNIYLDNGKITIEPNKYLGANKGLEPDEELVVVLYESDEKLKIMEDIVKLLNC